MTMNIHVNEAAAKSSRHLDIGRLAMKAAGVEVLRFRVVLHQRQRLLLRVKRSCGIIAFRDSF
jgi:hypothetical protein